MAQSKGLGHDAISYEFSPRSGKRLGKENSQKKSEANTARKRIKRKQGWTYRIGGMKEDV